MSIYIFICFTKNLRFYSKLNINASEQCRFCQQIYQNVRFAVAIVPRVKMFISGAELFLWGMISRFAYIFSITAQQKEPHKRGSVFRIRQTSCAEKQFRQPFRQSYTVPQPKLFSLSFQLGTEHGQRLFLRKPLSADAQSHPCS